jgi:cell division protein FtsQ
VNGATVTRAWPSAVRIVVTERRPIGAAMLGRSRYALVDRTGRVLGIVAAPPGGLVTLVGLADLPPPGGTLSEPGRAVLSVAAALPVALFPRVVSFSTTAEGVVAQLARGPLVLFGSPDAIGAKYVALATLLREEPAAIASARALDLRVPESPVLTP